MKKQRFWLFVALPLLLAFSYQKDPTIPVSGQLDGRLVITGFQRVNQSIIVRIKDDKGKVFGFQHASLGEGLFSFEGLNSGRRYWIDVNDASFLPKEIVVDFADPRNFAGRRLVIQLAPVDTSVLTPAQTAYLSTLNPDKLTSPSSAALDEFKKGIDGIHNPNPRDSVEAHLKKALSLDPKFYEAALALGLEQERQTQRDDAIKTLEHASTINVSDSRAFEVLGRLNLEDEQYKKSAEAFAHAEKLGPLSAEDHFSFGTAYYKSDDFASAVPELQQAIALAPGKIKEAYEELTNAYAKLNRKSDALATLQAYLGFYPNDKIAQLEADQLLPPAAANVQTKPPNSAATSSMTAAAVAPVKSDADTHGQSVVSVNVQMVEVYASVFDAKGGRVKDLKQEDFEVTEDGVAQAVKVFEPQVSELSIALLVDTTASMVRQLPQIKNSVADMLSKLGPDDSVGLFSFSTRLRALQPFTKNRSAVMTALMNTRAEGGTALYDALTQLSRELSATGGKKVILLFTDGLDNNSVLTLESATADIRKIGVPVYTVAQGELLHDDAGMKRLKQIATDTNGIALGAPTPQDLSSAFAKIVDDLQHLYLLGYYSSNPATKNDWRKITVRLPQHPELKIRTKEGYWR